MPRGDGTGPSGKGSRTGRGAGSCPPIKRKFSSFTSGCGRRFRGGR